MFCCVLHYFGSEVLVLHMPMVASGHYEQTTPLVSCVLVCFPCFKPHVPTTPPPSFYSTAPIHTTTLRLAGALCVCSLRVNEYGMWGHTRAIYMNVHMHVHVPGADIGLVLRCIVVNVHGDAHIIQIPGQCALDVRILLVWAWVWLFTLVAATYNSKQHLQFL